MATNPPNPACSLHTSLWEGTPTGTETTLPDMPNNPTYIASPPSPPTASESRQVAILLIHDLLGWTFPNTRLLADAYAREANATVYLPDFFGGEVVPVEPVLAGRFGEIDLPSIMARNAREIREPEIVGFARALRGTGRYERVGAIGFCYGGWAVFRLGSQEYDGEGGGRPGRGLVDCISAGHPSLLTERDVEGVEVPVQLLAPELDPVYSREMKMFTVRTLMEKGVPFDYQHFPGVVHGSLVRGDAREKGEREAMVRGKNAAVAWFRQWLHNE
jgi:dienelactone hydrolase